MNGISRGLKLQAATNDRKWTKRAYATYSYLPSHSWNGMDDCSGLHQLISVVIAVVLKDRHKLY